MSEQTNLRRGRSRCAISEARGRSRWSVLVLCTVGVLLIAATTSAQESPHGFHPIMPGQLLYFRCWSPQKGLLELQEVPLTLDSVGHAFKLKQRVALPEPWSAVELVEFLPAAELQQQVVSDDGPAAQAAVEIALAGPKQSLTRWLIANDPARNRLTSLIATWRFMAVKDPAERGELLRQFETELSREPKLRVSSRRTDAVREVPLKVGATQKLDDLGCTIRVKGFYPHYARDKDAPEPVNLSDKRVNPAASVEISRNDVTEHRWVFAKFPEFGQRGGDGLPFDVTLDCPVEGSRPLPDFVLVAVGHETLEVWTRHAGRTRIRAGTAEVPFEIPDSRYQFRISRFVPSGRLVETYHPAPKGAPALAVKHVARDGASVTTWLALGKYRTVETPAGPLTIGFDQDPLGTSGAHP